MTVFVTGGSGVVGSAVVRHLVGDGRDVRALARSSTSAEKLVALGAGPVEGDLSSRSSLTRAMTGCDVVYHVAGLNVVCADRPQDLFDVNVDGTRTVLQAANEVGVRRLVHTSSTTTLGERPGAVGSEETVHSGRFLTHYARSKYEAEAVAFAEAGQVEVVAVNPSSVQGPGRSTGTGRILLDAVNGDLPVMVDAPFSIVDVDDCARGHLLAEERGTPGNRYVLSGFTISAREALRQLGAITGRNDRVRFLPSWALAPVVPIAGLIGRFVDSVPICPESVRQLRAGARYDGSKATRVLGLEYRSSTETFARIIDWFRSEGLTMR